MNGVITLHEVLKEIDTKGAVFSIVYIQADRRKGTGGKIVRIPAAQKCDIASMDDNILKFNGIAESQKKDPNHWHNKTRNIYVPATRRIVKIHFKLITEFNGHTLVL